MTAYKVKTITGQVLTIEAEQIDFGPGHVVFYETPATPGVPRGGWRLVRALRTPFVSEVTEDQEP